MEIELLKERDTPLLSRKRLTFSVNYDKSTPSRIDLRKEIAKKIKAEEKFVILKHIYTRFGQQWAKVIAHVYNNEEELNKFENKKLVAKHSGKKEEKAETETAKGSAPEAKKEAPAKEEKPAEKESPKEESAPEAKKEAPAKEEKKEEVKEDKPEAPAEEKKE
ncbi:30S ribosomal protein S24e [Nanoarchaeota archaeon]